jgi:hypothetical protein
MTLAAKPTPALARKLPTTTTAGEKPKGGRVVKRVHGGRVRPGGGRAGQSVPEEGGGDSMTFRETVLRKLEECRPEREGFHRTDDEGILLDGVKVKWEGQTFEVTMVEATPADDPATSSALRVCGEFLGEVGEWEPGTFTMGRTTEALWDEALKNAVHGRRP